MVEAVDTDLLPDSALVLVDVVGLSGALALIEQYGGTRLYVPQSIPDDHELMALLGSEAAEALSERFGGDNPGIPRAYQAVQAALYRDIVRAYANGASARELARQHRCTERWIYYLVARERAALDSRQTSLFG